MDVIDIITACAKIPSFSTMEHYIHPYIHDFVNANRLGEIEYIHKNNLVVFIPSAAGKEGNKDRPLIALTAHLDKINHFGENPPHTLLVKVDEDKITGQLDDAVGVGICLFCAYVSRTENFPRLVLLFSEMEENGPYINPDQGIISGLGARRISEYLLSLGEIPSLFLTIDTTPFYNGKPGISLYSRFWEICSLKPTLRLTTLTDKIENFFLSEFPDINHQNNTNDYITYGNFFNTQKGYTIPSIALEPAIYPSHCREETVFLSDIQRVVSILSAFLGQFPFYEFTDDLY